ncbi:MAG: DUF47 family protein [Oscillospiraceae bacterium]|nr:DUF47 family protein [Oscillospiraceae bacterium]
MFKKTSQTTWNLVDQHMRYVFECYCAFEKFMEEFLGGDKPAGELMHLYEDVSKLEGDADVARRNIINAFLDGKLLPSTRKEILDIIARMDKIANKCQDIACKFVFQNVTMPAAYRANFLEITKITKEQYLLMKRALRILFDDYDRLIKDESILGDIMEKEHDVDTIEDATTLALFRDASLDLTQRHYYKHFLSQLCDISDKLEDLADQIQVIVVLRKV